MTLLEKLEAHLHNNKGDRRNNGGHRENRDHETP